MTLRNYLLKLIPFSLFFLSSNQTLNAQNLVYTDFLKTESGLMYKIFPGQGREKPEVGAFVKFHLKYTVGKKDSVLQSTFAKIPAYAAIDTGKQVQYSFMEIIPGMSIGDSAETIIYVDSLVSKNLIADYNSIFQEGDILRCQLKLLGIFKSDSLMQIDYQKEIALEKDREDKDIEDYMSQMNLPGKKTKNGVYVLIENSGDPTLKADSGKLVSVSYKGYYFNGEVFDTNMDSSKSDNKPLQIIIGKKQVIQGLEEGLSYFTKGAKGKIFIPAMLGYGPQQQDYIPPYSNLIFDVQIIDVKNAP